MAVFAGYQKRSKAGQGETHFVLVGTVQAIPSRQASSISSHSLYFPICHDLDLFPDKRLGK